MFHGSYHPSDVTFLLKPLCNATLVDVAEKEQLIQSGQKHYSEMISLEQQPSAAYMQLFEQAWAQNGDRTALDHLKLAAKLHASKLGHITLISLARAGTPVGVILKRLLENIFQRSVTHYSVSIIRDRGIDTRALDYILAQGHSAESIAFIDGWTGKGVITQELHHSIMRYNQDHHSAIDPSLWVIADLAGVAHHAATQDDYLIPSSILNATISGLISRSILDDSIRGDDFHGCLYYEHLEAQDISLRYVNDLCQRAQKQAHAHPEYLKNQPHPSDAARKEHIKSLMSELMQRHNVQHINHIKPGIGEATRVLLRRAPKLLILRHKSDDNTQHMRSLASDKNIPTHIDPSISPYQAIAIIKDIRHAAP
ncbi:MAG: cysteine protease StiP domain-containing protein [Halothiobacillaceae bacterium]